MKRKILLILVIVLGAAFGAGGFFIYKYVANNEKEVVSKTSEVEEETPENQITTYKETLNLFLNGSGISLHTSLIDKNYHVSFTNNNIVEIKDNSEIIPINVGKTVATFTNTNNDTLAEYTITVWGDISFNCSAQQDIWINTSYQFSYTGDHDFSAIDIQTDIDNDDITVAKPTLQNDNKKLSINFGFEEFTVSNESVKITTTFTFDNQVVKNEKTLNFKIYKPTTKYTFSYLNANKAAVENFTTLSVLQNAFYVEQAITDGVYSSVYLNIEPDANTLFKVNIENLTPEIINLSLNNQSFTTLTTNEQQIKINEKGTEGTAKIKITDAYSSFSTTVEFEVQKVYATEYTFTLKNNMEFVVDDVFTVEIESYQPAYAFTKDFTISSENNNLTIEDKTITFNQVGPCAISIFDEENKALDNLSLTVNDHATSSCVLTSSLPNWVIDNELKTITITEANTEDYVSINLVVKFNNTSVNKNEINFVYDINCLEVDNKNYPTVLIRLKKLDFSSSLVLQFKDTSVTYNLTVS